jgi:small neutral amino acid transporter SnatA (MarC family)
MILTQRPAIPVTRQLKGARGSHNRRGTMPVWASAFFVLAGLFSFAGAVFDWEWFMTHYRAALFVRLFGRNGARIVYALLGILLAALGLAGVSGLLA